MTAGTVSERSSGGTVGADSSSARRRRGAALLGGTVLLALLLGTEALPFYWLPTLSGVAYLAGAAAGGRRGALWAPGLMVTGWGIAALLLFEGAIPGSYTAPAFLLGLGIGGVVAAALHQARIIEVSPLGVAVTLVVSGVFLALEVAGTAGIAGNAYPYAVLLAVWGLWELRPAR